MINERYADTKVQQKMRDVFQAETEFPCVTLFTFLDPKAYEKIQQDVIRSFFRHELALTSHSYDTAPLPSSLARFLQSSELADFLSSVVGSKVRVEESKLYQFAWKDYTLLSDLEENPPGIDLCMDFTDYWAEQAGGQVMYKDEHGNFIELPRGGNIMSLVRRKENVQRYVRYVNHYAEKMRRYIVFARVIPEPQKNL